MSSNTEFKLDDYVVYPTHGVGKIMGVEKQSIAGHELSLYVIFFEKDKMTLRVPVSRAKIAGLRSLSNDDDIKKAFVILKKKAKISRGMWSKRAQEYESKINSGNIAYIAEVVRDLHRNVDHPERSYSERVIYESALNRFAGEIAAIKKIDTNSAVQDVLEFLVKKAA